jgi:ubiquinone biosynthesis protein COQ9
MNTRNQNIQDKIILAALEDVAFDGWKWPVIEAAAVKAGYGEDMAMAVFPEKLSAILACFSELSDRQMLSALEDTNPDDLRVRDRIKTAVLARLGTLEPHKEAVRAASVYWLVPTRKVQAAKQVWKTADIMWNWAGDEAQDYNHYTKRILLSGVITATTMTWLNDTSENHQNTKEFLDRRISNVLKIGGAAGKFMGPILGRCGFFNKKKTKV